MRRYVGLLWFGLADIIFLAGKRFEMTSKMGDYKDSPYGSDEQCGVGHSSDLADTLRSLKEKIRSFKVDNDIIIMA